MEENKDYFDLKFPFGHLKAAGEPARKNMRIVSIGTILFMGVLVIGGVVTVLRNPSILENSGNSIGKGLPPSI